MTSVPAAFRFEHEMLEPLAAGLPALIHPDGMCGPTVLREPYIGAVIPDLMLGWWPPHHSWAPRSRSTGVEAHVMALLERVGRLTPMQIAERLGLPDAVADRAIGSLTTRGAAQAVSHGRYAVSDATQISDFTIVAVEAKLYRWRTALAQATAYRGFADRAYVVVDSARVPSTSAVRGACREAGVGLILQQRNSDLQLVVAARARRPKSATRVYAADALFAAPAAQQDL